MAATEGFPEEGNVTPHLTKDTEPSTEQSPGSLDRPLVGMDEFVKKTLLEWNLAEFLPTFEAEKIDEDSFFLLDGDCLTSLIPLLGPRLKFQRHLKKLLEEKREFQEEKENESPLTREATFKDLADTEGFPEEGNVTPHLTKDNVKHNKDQGLKKHTSGDIERPVENMVMDECSGQHFHGKSRREESTDNEQSIDEEVEELLNKLNLRGRYQDKCTLAEVLAINPSSPQRQDTLIEKELARTFLQRLLAIDYTARNTLVKKSSEHTNVEESSYDAFFDESISIADDGKLESGVHPMDLQMAVFHCSDSFLQQYIVSKLSLCQYALPFLVPNLLTKEIECPLWAFRQVRKSWRATDNTNTTTSPSAQTRVEMPIYQAKTPMVAVFRLGSISTSKSQLLSNLINPRHSMFFHRNCPGSTKTSLLMEGVVEIAWYCPAGQPDEAFTDCVAFCNLHGDAVANEKQRNILTESATVNVVILSSQSGDHKMILQELFKSPKPLVCLFTNDNTPVTAMKGKYKMGLRDISQSDVSEALQKIIRESLSGSSCTFQLEDIAKNTVVRVDETFEDCRRAKTAALEINSFLGESELLKIKQDTLPCQGKLWHDWCNKNKNLYRLQGNTEIENSKIKIQDEMKKIREEQKSSCSEYISQLIANLQSLTRDQRLFFLKWVGIQLDDFSSKGLSDILHQYNKKWSEVLDLKKTHNKSTQLKDKQKELEEISVELQAATFGLEHIFREMGQIYEAYASSPQNSEVNMSYLPKLAAELMISGHPMELMDGDAAHVPLMWIKSVQASGLPEPGRPEGVCPVCVGHSKQWEIDNAQRHVWTAICSECWKVYQGGIPADAESSRRKKGRIENRLCSCHRHRGTSSPGAAREGNYPP